MATKELKKAQEVEKRTKAETKKGRLSYFRDKYPEGILRIVNMKAVLR
jgi:hypothetical protein